MQDLSSVEASAFCEKGQSVFNMLEESKAISVAMVDGFALGGGFELALACDVIFASSQSKFGLPEVGLGLIPGFGGTQRLSRSLGLHLAKALTLSGDMVDAQYLESKALIYKVAENREALETEVKSYLKRVLSKGPKAVDTAKSAIQEGFSLSFKEALKHEKQEFALLFGTKETEEGMTAFLEKRKPNF
jgi:enoyl-CoA hydratase